MSETLASLTISLNVPWRSIEDPFFNMVPKQFIVPRLASELLALDLLWSLNNSLFPDWPLNGSRNSSLTVPRMTSYIAYAQKIVQYTIVRAYIRSYTMRLREEQDLFSVASNGTH